MKHRSTVSCSCVSFKLTRCSSSSWSSNASDSVSVLRGHDPISLVTSRLEFATKLIQSLSDSELKRISILSSQYSSPLRRHPFFVRISTRHESVSIPRSTTSIRPFKMHPPYSSDVVRCRSRPSLQGKTAVSLHPQRAISARYRNNSGSTYGCVHRQFHSQWSFPNFHQMVSKIVVF